MGRTRSKDRLPLFDLKLVSIDNVSTLHFLAFFSLIVCTSFGLLTTHSFIDLDYADGIYWDLTCIG